MLTGWLLGSLLALAGNLFAVDVAEISFDVAMPAKIAPKVDGVLDDACWKEALPHTIYYEYTKLRPKHKFVRTAAGALPPVRDNAREGSGGDRPAQCPGVGHSRRMPL